MVKSRKCWRIKTEIHEEQNMCENFWNLLFLVLGTVAPRLTTGKIYQFDVICLSFLVLYLIVAFSFQFLCSTWSAGMKWEATCSCKKDEELWVRDSVPGFANGTTAQACVVWDDDTGDRDDDDEDGDDGSSIFNLRWLLPVAGRGRPVSREDDEALRQGHLGSWVHSNILRELFWVLSSCVGWVILHELCWV